MKGSSSTVGLYELRAAFKDPVHGLIPVNLLEYEIIQHPIFLRLHGIRQLGFTHFVYPQARHTRFEHSLGSMHIAYIMAHSFLENSRDIIRELMRKNAEEYYPAFVQLVRLQALLHDLGHLPFSHATERVIEKFHSRNLLEGSLLEEVEASRRRGFKVHEHLSCTLIEKLMRDLNLSKYKWGRELFSGVRESLCRRSDGKWRKLFTEMGVRVARAMMSGKITDVDRMDYLLRDAYNTGATYGHYDVTRLATGLSVKIHGGKVKLAAPVKLLSNIEELYYSRYMMYKWVYLHHKVGALELTYERVLELMARDWRSLRSAVSKLLPRPPAVFWDLFTGSSIWKYATRYGVRLDDTLMESLIRIAQNQGSEELRTWARGLIERRTPLQTLFKRQESLLMRLAAQSDGKGGIDEGFKLLVKLMKWAHDKGVDLDFLGSELEDFINSRISQVRVRVYVNPPISSGSAEEPLIDVDGVLHPVERVSMFINSLQKMGSAPIIYVYYLGGFRLDTAKLAEKVTELIREFIVGRTGSNDAGEGVH